MDEVLADSASGKSQLYHYFADRQDLVRAVVDRQRQQVLAGQPHLTSVRSWDDLEAWAGEVIAIHSTDAGPLACPLGSLAAETRADPVLRQAVADAFDSWLDALTAALATLQQAGEVTTRTEARSLAVRVLSALQGAMLLGSTLNDAAIVADVVRAQLAAIRLPPAVGT